MGRRVDFVPGFPGDYSLPGDYAKVPDEIDPRENGVWYLVDPMGKVGAALPSIHNIIEHDNGTISCSPSLVTPSGWHGFLVDGIWT